MYVCQIAIYTNTNTDTNEHTNMNENTSTNDVAITNAAEPSLPSISVCESAKWGFIQAQQYMSHRPTVRTLALHLYLGLYLYLYLCLYLYLFSASSKISG